MATMESYGGHQTLEDPNYSAKDFAWYSLGNREPTIKDLGESDIIRWPLLGR